jgi:hypothetical protein
MKHFFLLISAVLLLGAAVNGQEYSLSLMPDVWNSNYTNPGLYPRQHFILSLPSVHGSIQSIGLNRANMFRYDQAEEVYYLNYGEVIDKINRDVRLRSSAVIDALALGFKADRFFISFSTNTCVDGNLTLPEDFFRFVWEGTANYLDQPLNVGPQLNVMGYQKLGLGVSYAVRPNLSVGVRLNRLIGLASFQTNRSELSVTQNSEIYQTRFKVDYMVNYYAAGGLEPIDEMVDGISNFEGELGSFEWASGSSLRNYSNGNGGWSVDLGGEYFHNQQWTFAASLLNLGAIRWKHQTQQLHFTEDYTYEGVVVDGLAEEEDIDFDSVSDTLETLLDFEAISNQQYTQGLSPRTYLSARYSPSAFVTFGGLVFNEFSSSGTFTGLALSSRLSLGRILSVGGIYAFQFGARNSLGLNTALKLGPFQVYAIADNITPLINPERLDGTNFRAGLNLTFGRKKMDKQLAFNLNPSQPQDLSAATRPLSRNRLAKSKKPKNRAGKAKKKEKEPVEDAVAAAEPTEEEETIAPVETPKKKHVTTRKKNKKQITETAVVNEGIREEEESPGNYFHLEAVFKDELTEMTVEVVYIDIYRTDEEGDEELVRTGRFTNGMLDVLLNKSSDPHVLLATAYGYEPVSFDFIAIPGNEPAKNQYMKAVPDVQEAPNFTESPLEEEESPLVPSSENTVPPVVTDKEAPNTVEESPSTADAPESAPANAPKERYYLTDRTSLRSHATSSGDVLTRLPVGAELFLLEKTNQWWWLMSYNGQRGWVKASLLKQL